MSSTPHDSEPSELYQAIERSALTVYEALLSPDLAQQAATAFATETTALVQDRLDEGVAVLREQIQEQLEALNGTPKGKKKTSRKTNGTKSTRPKKAAPSSAKPARTDRTDKPAGSRKSESNLLAAAKKADAESAQLDA